MIEDVHAILDPLLESRFFGQEVRGFLCGIASTVDGLAASTALRTYLMEVMGVDEKTCGTAEEYMFRELDTAFAFRERAGNAVGCVSRVGYHAGWLKRNSYLYHDTRVTRAKRGWTVTDAPEESTGLFTAYVNYCD